MSTTTAVLVWHFAGPALRDGRQHPKAGDTLTHDGPLKLCASGLHGSEDALAALGYAPGPFVARCELRGTILADTDKHVASERHYLTGYVDVSRVLREFACDCAERALNREREKGREPDPRPWEAIKAARAFVRGDLDAAKLAAAGDAAWAAAGDAARAAAWAAGGAAAWAAWAAARAAAGAAAWAARDAAWGAAWDAERKWQSEHLTALLTEATR